MDRRIDPRLESAWNVLEPVIVDLMRFRDAEHRQKFHADFTKAFIAYKMGVTSDFVSENLEREFRKVYSDTKLYVNRIKSDMVFPNFVTDVDSIPFFESIYKRAERSLQELNSR